MASEDSIKRAAQRLAAQADPGARLILFGSLARGEPRPRSDVDVL